MKSSLRALRDHCVGMLSLMDDKPTARSTAGGWAFLALIAIILCFAVWVRFGGGWSGEVTP